MDPSLLLPASGSPRCSLACGSNSGLCFCLHMSVFSFLSTFLLPHDVFPLYVFIFSSYKDTSHITPWPALLIIVLNLLPLQDPYFQIRSHSQVWMVRASAYLLEEWMLFNYTRSELEDVSIWDQNLSLSPTTTPIPGRMAGWEMGRTKSLVIILSQ